MKWTSPRSVRLASRRSTSSPGERSSSSARENSRPRTAALRSTASSCAIEPVETAREQGLDRCGRLAEGQIRRFPREGEHLLREQRVTPGVLDDPLLQLVDGLAGKLLDERAEHQLG